MRTYEELMENDELFMDEDDKHAIMTMPVLQREQKLNERYDKIKETRISKAVREMDKMKDAHQPASKPAGPKPRIQDCDFIVPRDLIISNIFKPSINLLKGSFVRAMINKKYVICKVVGFNRIEPYPLMDKLKNMCTLGLCLNTGIKTIEGLQATSVSSSSSTTLEEFEAFLESFEIESFDDLKNKFYRIKQEFSRSLTDDEVTKTIENRLKDNPKRITNIERKIEIIAKRDEAIQFKEKERGILYQKQLENIEDEERAERRRKLVENTEKRKRRTYN